MKDNFSTLQDNIRLLGSMLGDTVREAHGQALFDKVEEIRGLSKLSHTADAAIDLDAVSEALLSLSNDELTPVARAFSQFLNLVNIAENYQAVSFYQNEDASDVFDLDNVYAQLRDKQLSDEEIGRAVSKLKIELVLTAHPTEVIRRTLIHKYGEINECLKRLDTNNMPEHEASLVNQRLRELIAQAWHTNEIRQARPTPVDEAKWGFAVIENSLWEAVPRYLRQLDKVQQDYVGKRLPLEASPIRFVSWMGGDRDGNPNVTAKVTREVMLLSRWKAVDLYLPEVQKLTTELSMYTCSQEVRQLVGDAAEPYRALLHRLEARLRNTRDWINAQLAGQIHSGEDIISHIDDLWEPLNACYRSLHEAGIGIVADGRLLDLLRRVRCFGIHLVRLDIRQESGRHAQVFSELTQYMGLGDYASWEESQRQAFLLQELDSKRPLFPRHWQPSAEVAEVLATCRVIAEQPKQALGSYVISMAKVPSDVLAVKLLLKEADCSFSMPVAPLFETLDDLNNAAGVMDALFKIDWYREEISGWQMVMIGYSDSAKDAGNMAASWAQYRAQEELIATCAEYDVALTLFHGRGGTIGRGGVSAHAAMLSQPPGSLLTGMRVTEQGETIRTKLGLPDVAIKTFNLYTHAILEAFLQPPPSPKQEWRDIMDKLSDISCESYRNTVYQQPDFIPYFRQATPELELGKLPLGSRPAKRNPHGGVESLRAIPWIFAWIQNRMMLPAWLGAGAALSDAIAQGYKSDLETMCREWPFFSTRLGMLEMVYAKADVMLAEYYDRRLVEPRLWPLGEALRTQLQQDIATVLDIANDEHLLQQDPWIQKAIELRKIYTDPLNVLQAELLCRNRKKTDPDIERALMVTIAGVAAGMRNTG